MPKAVAKLRKYNNNWEKEEWARGWLTQAASDSFHEAYCTVCKTSLRAHASDLKSHSKNVKHKKNASRFFKPKNQRRIEEIIEVKNEEKVNDMKLAFFTAVHTSIRSIDHLSDLLKKTSETFKNLRLHRTKCSAIIKKVIAPCMLQELLEDLKGKYYSLIVDESTDISVLKYMCICVKYFSTKYDMIVIDFLGIVEVESSTGASLYEILINFLNEVHLEIKYLIGLGTDGDQALIGVNNSLFSRLKELNPNMQLVRCVAHSLNNAASSAAHELPANVDFLSRVVYNWFCHSSKRQIEYQRLFSILNSGMKKQHKFHQTSETRWLARYNVVNTILEQWEELKVLFNTVVDKEKCYTARQLKDMFNDSSNLLYLIVLRPILLEVNKVNTLFQRNNVDIGRAYEDLCGLIMFLARKVMTPPFVNAGEETIINNVSNDLAYVLPEKSELGSSFYQTALSSDIKSTLLYNVQHKLFPYIKRLLKELVTRLPTSLRFFKSISLLSPTKCLSLQRRHFDELPFITNFCKMKGIRTETLEVQYEKLLNLQWSDHLCGAEFEDAYLFWPKVAKYKDAGGQYAFKDLSEYAFYVLSFPSSNAVVERVFSFMNAVKIKSRNRMQTELLCAILRVKVRACVSKVCCCDFTPTVEMHRIFNSKIYDKDMNTAESNEENETFEIN